LTSELPDLGRRLLELRYADIHRPERRRLDVRRSRHDTGDGVVAGAIERRVRLTRAFERRCLPADHNAVERFGHLHVRSHQLIPERPSEQRRCGDSHKTPPDNVSDSPLTSTIRVRATICKSATKAMTKTRRESRWLETEPELRSCSTNSTVQAEEFHT